MSIERLQEHKFDYDDDSFSDKELSENSSFKNSDNETSFGVDALRVMKTEANARKRTHMNEDLSDDTRPKLVKKSSALVSYSPESVAGDDSDEDIGNIMYTSKHPIEKSSERDDGQDNEERIKRNESHKSRAVKDLHLLPPAPRHQCSVKLQKTVTDRYERMLESGVDYNRSIQRRKDFRNPSIYDKLIEFCHIDEKGTMFDPMIYNPTIWGKESDYEHLAMRREEEEQERKKKKGSDLTVQRMSGIKKTVKPVVLVSSQIEKHCGRRWESQSAVGQFLKK